MKKNNLVKWLTVLSLLSYVTGVFVIADKSLWLGMIPVLTGACLSWLAIKTNKEEIKES